MPQITFHIPDDEVNCFVLRRMSNGLYVASAEHRFGFVRDTFGNILGPTAPHGVASHTDPETCMTLALEDLRKEVAKKVEEQNARGNLAGQYPRLASTPLPAGLAGIELDL